MFQKQLLNARTEHPLCELGIQGDDTPTLDFLLHRANGTTWRYYWTGGWRVDVYWDDERWRLSMEKDLKFYMWTGLKSAEKAALMYIMALRFSRGKAELPWNPRASKEEKEEVENAIKDFLD